MRTLWSWVLDAIARDVLIPILPKGVLLDMPFDHGGIRLTWRQVIVAASRAIERYIPSNDAWANTPMLDPAVFYKWLAEDLAGSIAPARSRFPKRRRPPDHLVRRIAQRCRERELESGRTTSIQRMWEYVKNTLPETTRDRATEVLQAIEGGSKGRGRPRSTAKRGK